MNRTFWDLEYFGVPVAMETTFFRVMKRMLCGEQNIFMFLQEKFRSYENEICLVQQQKYSKIKPAFIAETLGPTLLELRRKYNVDSDKLTDENFRNFFGLNFVQQPLKILIKCIALKSYYCTF